MELLNPQFLTDFENGSFRDTIELADLLDCSVILSSESTKSVALLDRMIL